MALERAAGKVICPRIDSGCHHGKSNKSINLINSMRVDIISLIIHKKNGTTSWIQEVVP